VIQSDGKILAAGGGPGNAIFNSDIMLVRYEGCVADIEISGNGRVIVSGDTTPSTLDHTDFGSVAAGGGALSRTFSIRNADDKVELTLTGQAPDYVTTDFFSAFRLTQQPSLGIIAPGDRESFTVELCSHLCPAVGESRPATMTVRSNDMDEGVCAFHGHWHRGG